MSTPQTPPSENGEALEPVVRVRGLNHVFGEADRRQQVLYDVEFDLHPGELVILTGPSGCGKTTLLTLTGGLRTIQKGQVRVLGHDLHKLDQDGRRTVRPEIGFIFQSHNLLDALTAAQNVSLPLDLKSYTPHSLYAHAVYLLETFEPGSASRAGLDGLPRQTRQLATALAVGLLKHLEVDDRAEHKPAQLSGGQKQRVAIARAIINHPRLILADEPTAALDKDASRIVLDVLRKLTRHGTAGMLVTHDPRVIERADRVLTLKDGRIVSNTPVNETVNYSDSSPIPWAGEE
jgi:putative ABC transport system ATP-binding protein